MVERRQGRRDGIGALRPAPIIVLVEPQLGENIGAAARAMLNFGLSELRLVAPRDGWPNPAADAMASGAATVIERARIFASLGEAIADCRYVLATTARPREMLLPAFEPSGAVKELKARVDRGEICAVLFGRERAGLDNDEVARADAVISIPVNPSFASLNLAQAALIIAYEWAKADGREPFAGGLDEALPAAKEDFERLMVHLIEELDARGYFFPPEKREGMERNLKVAFMRAGLTEGEVRTLRGVIKALARNPAGSD
ncbi:MAG TPA: RNA methyltransferase [Parvularculaceae bacterium]|nr:RNA methyltransferase [Parvularculaceae bacterium]